MKITIVTGPFYPVPPAPCGAVERLMHDLAEHFAARGHAVTVLCRGWPDQQSDETIAGVTYHRRWQPRRTGNIKIDLVKDFLYSLRMLFAVRRGDVILTNVFWLPMLLTMLRPRAGKVVVNVNRQPKGQMKLYKRAARIVGVSTAIADAIREQCPAVSSIVKMIPNPIDTAVFTPPPVPRDGEVRRLVYTGRVNPEKGIHVLLMAMRLLKDRGLALSLRIIGQRNVAQGGGDEAYQRWLDELAAGIDATFVDPIYDRVALADELRAADVFVYPSLAEQGEAMPVAPVEAMATGLVPIVSAIPQFNDYVHAGETGEVFDHRNADDAAIADRLAAVIAALHADPAKVRRLSTAATIVAQGFGYEPIASAYIADFEQLLAAK